MRGVETKARAEKLIEVLTGEKPSVCKKSDGRTMIRCTGRHVEALAQYEELREAIERWSDRKAPETQKTFKQIRYGSRRGCPSQVNGAGGCPPG